MICALLCSCGGECRIDLESALRSTKKGEFDLIVIAERFVSFQGPGLFIPRKCQYYFSPPSPHGVVAKIKTAADEARAKKLEVHIWDNRGSAEDPQRYDANDPENPK